jgi:hypothetical protein
MRRELVLLGGLAVCVVIALVTVVLPELGTGDADDKKLRTPAAHASP